MRFIEHIIEPTKLLLAWQSSDESHRTRYVVAELNRVGDKIDLTYLIDSEDFRKAQSKGFESYPAFQDVNKVHHNVIDTFMRRLPPRTRGDFAQYMEGLRLKPDTKLSNFALLGYSGARLPSDGFSLIHPFNGADGAFELILDAAGFRHIQKNHDGIKIGDEASFAKEFNEATQEESIHILVDGKHIGYVNRGLLPSFFAWMNSKRIKNAWVEKINGAPGRPAVYLYVQISPAGK
ncbi:MAG TPA: hypothetical protein VNC84_00105 [Gammaproteobacteria bacterium]|jgi:hypothetical protein|nr:hypothetical protein [Gammaproteobacteria bacterium]